MNNEEKPYPSRLKKKKNRSNSILNILIGLVFALILIIGVSMLFGGGNEQAQDPDQVASSPEIDEQTSGTEDSEGTEETAKEKKLLKKKLLKKKKRPLKKRKKKKKKKSLPLKVEQLHGKTRAIRLSKKP
ncbi:hypothetical protein [Planococcus faecalis]|uniref:hypothetical protein n=1 Tax=Planococcus faecalis TaxID=1598147 RepID=UPI000A73BAB5|nr:hypothetical protein [Planococcus faecalis]